MVVFHVDVRGELNPFPLAAFRGLGHVLGISRGLSSFKHPDADASDMEEGSASVNTTADVPGDDSGIRWSANVGSDLRRNEKCLFDTVA